MGVAGPAEATNQSGFCHQRLCCDAGSCPALIGPHLSTVPRDENSSRPFSRKAANLSVWTRAYVKLVFMTPNVNVNLVNLDHRQSFKAVALFINDTCIFLFHHSCSQICTRSYIRLTYGPMSLQAVEKVVFLSLLRSECRFQTAAVSHKL